MSAKRNILFQLQDKAILLSGIETSNSQQLRELNDQTPSNEPLEIALPNWINPQLFEIFVTFLSNQSQPQIYIESTKKANLRDQHLQRLLWIGDYFSFEKFQDSLIQDVILPRIGQNNCILFLNEGYLTKYNYYYQGFNKLNAYEDSNEIWFKLLNTTMNFTAKNLLWLYENKQTELLKLQTRIVEEVIERCLKYCKNNVLMNQKKIYENIDQIQGIIFQLFQKIKHCEDIAELLNLHKKNILNKKINIDNYSSITWKLSNIQSIVNKEINAFKFNGYLWKLFAREEKKTLKFYFKIQYDTSSDLNNLSQTHETLNLENDLQKDNTEELITIYFQVRINNKPINHNFQLKHIFLTSSNQNKIELQSQTSNSPYLNQEIVICQFTEKEIQSLSNQNLEFTVLINLDNLYSTLISYIIRHCEELTQKNSYEIQNFCDEDLKTIICGLNKNVNSGELGLLLAMRWIQKQTMVHNQKQNQQFIELLSCIHWNIISTSSLQKLLNMRKIKQNNELKIFLEQKLQQKNFDTHSQIFYTSIQSSNKPQSIMNDSSQNCTFTNTSQMESSNKQQDYSTNKKRSSKQIFSKAFINHNFSRDSQSNQNQKDSLPSKQNSQIVSEIELQSQDSSMQQLPANKLEKLRTISKQKKLNTNNIVGLTTMSCSKTSSRQSYGINQQYPPLHSVCKTSTKQKEIEKGMDILGERDQNIKNASQEDKEKSDNISVKKMILFNNGKENTEQNPIYNAGLTQFNQGEKEWRKKVILQETSIQKFLNTNAQWLVDEFKNF